MTSRRPITTRGEEMKLAHLRSETPAGVIQEDWLRFRWVIL